MLNRTESLKLLKTYNVQPFHIEHALTVGAVMKWFAEELGFADDKEYWELVGLLHDIDYEKYPEEHCKKSIEILSSAGFDSSFIKSVCSHGYGICSDVEPEHLMEKVLFATDELTGLIGAAAKMRPSKSVSDMEVKSLKKKFKDKAFAAGCSRDIIKMGAERLNWTMEELFERTILAMRACEEDVKSELKEHKA